MSEVIEDGSFYNRSFYDRNSYEGPSFFIFKVDVFQYTLPYPYCLKIAIPFLQVEYCRIL